MTGRSNRFSAVKGSGIATESAAWTAFGEKHPRACFSKTAVWPVGKHVRCALLHYERVQRTNAGGTAVIYI